MGAIVGGRAAGILAAVVGGLIAWLDAAQGKFPAGVADWTPDSRTLHHDYNDLAAGARPQPRASPPPSDQTVPLIAPNLRSTLAGRQH
jgi:hypothetical protein